eukprot:m.57385 g.57385  ORF g.57385 m.57385 type:complete len:162 (-) comp17086_c0_seq1:137-622(-)
MMKILAPAVITALVCQVHSASLSAEAVCTADLNCSLNGVCSTQGVCVCDAPWKGPSCGVLSYKVTPASGRSLYPESDPRNTWNGAIIQDPNGGYHLYNPIYAAGTLGGTTTMLHATADNVTGPYRWGVLPDITIDELGSFNVHCIAHGVFRLFLCALVCVA